MKKIMLLLFLATLIFSGCSEAKEHKIERENFLFGTYIKITVYDKDKRKAEKAIDKAFEEIERVDKKFNTHSEGSVIDKVNKSTNKRVVVDSETREIFKKVENAYKISEGKYDITISPLMAAWGFTTGKEIDKVPSKKEIEEALSKVDYSKVSLGKTYLSFEPPVEKIDTGSFLKGYALSRAKVLMEEDGIKSAFLTSISSIETIGTKPGGKKWRIGLQNPSMPSEILDIVNLDGKAMGVSGDYQTFVEIDGKKYHHILDIKTGYPVADKKMVVVICEDTFSGDIYSTTFFLMPIKEILKCVEDNKDLEVLVVDSDSQITTSSGFRKYLQK